MAAYAYPTNRVFRIDKNVEPKKRSKESKALQDYYETHDFSIIRDDATGKLILQVQGK